MKMKHISVTLDPLESTDHIWVMDCTECGPLCVVTSLPLAEQIQFTHLEDHGAVVIR